MKSNEAEEKDTNDGALPPLHATPGSGDTLKLAAMRLRVTALYHNCMSAAAFKREDAMKEENEDEQIALRREAMAYECCAEWLRNATK